MSLGHASSLTGVYVESSSTLHLYERCVTGMLQAVEIGCRDGRLVIALSRSGIGCNCGNGLTPLLILPAVLRIGQSSGHSGSRNANCSLAWGTSYGCILRPSRRASDSLGNFSNPAVPLGPLTRLTRHKSACRLRLPLASSAYTMCTGTWAVDT